MFDAIGILAKKHGPNVTQTLGTLIDHLFACRKRIVVEDGPIAADPRVASCPAGQLGCECDLVVVVGGDGTLLAAGRTLAAYDTPLLGVNLGRLGFLVDVRPEAMTATLDAIFAGRYSAESRLMLTAAIQHADGRFEGGVFPAVNEFAVRNQAFARVLDFDTYMNGGFISHHRADGIIIATPTGSTAYALSCGGPVMHPDLSALALVPVCPHSLTDRPLIVDGAHCVEVEITTAYESAALFTSDGQAIQSLGHGDRVRIERGPHELKLIHPPDYDYFDILRKKLLWGRG
jgi:NAD+ kinase